MKEQEKPEEMQPPERLVSGTYSIISQLTDPTSLVEAVPAAASPTSAVTSFQSERISLDDVLDDDSDDIDIMDEKAAAMPPPLQRNVSIHEQKGLLLQQSPGAISILGSSNGTGNTGRSPSSQQDDDQEQPSYEESYTTTAIAISNEDLESEIRGRILQNAVQASHIQAEKPGHQKRNLGMVVCLAVAAILAAVLVTRLLLIQPDKKEEAVPTFSPQPNNAPSTPSPTQRPTLLPTFSPTAAPTTDRNRLLAEYLRPLTFDQGESMDRPGTPQSNAFRTVVARRNLYPGEDLVTTYALLVLFESMQGSRWTNSTNWYSGSSVCTWHGVTCKPSSQTQRRRLMQPKLMGGDKDGMNVAGLRLSNNQLLGTIPPEVALLPLEVLDLSGNHLVDSIPSELKHLKQLKFLNLQGNDELYGAIPEPLCMDGVILQVNCATVTCSCCVPDCLLMAPAAAPVAAAPVADMLPSLVTSPGLTTPTAVETPILSPVVISVPTSGIPLSPVTTPVLSPLAAPTVVAVPTLPTWQSLPTVPTVLSVPTAQTVPIVPTTPTSPSLPTPQSLPVSPSTQAQPTSPSPPVVPLPVPTTPSAPQVARTQAPVITPTNPRGTPAPTGRLNAPVETPVAIPAPSPVVVTVPEDGFPAPTQAPVVQPVLQPVPKPVGYPPTVIPPFSIPAQLPVYAPNAPPAIAPSIPTIPSILQQPILQPTLNLVPSQIAILAPLLPPNLKPALPKIEWTPVRPPTTQTVPESAIPDSPVATAPAPVVIPSSIPLSPLSAIPEGSPSLLEAPAPVESPTVATVPNQSSSTAAPVSSNVEETPIDEATASPAV